MIGNGWYATNADLGQTFLKETHHVPIMLLRIRKVRVFQSANDMLGHCPSEIPTLTLPVQFYEVISIMTQLLMVYLSSIL